MKSFLVAAICTLALFAGTADSGSLRRPRAGTSRKGEEEGYIHVQRCEESLYAACVTRTTNYTTTGPVPFKEVLINDGALWDTNNDILELSETGTYFFHMSAGVLPFTPLLVNLEGLQTTVSLSRESTSHNGVDSMGRDFIFTVDNPTNISFQNLASSQLYGESDRQTSLTAFRLDDVLNPKDMTVFSVSRESLFASVGEVEFPIEHVNIGDAFDSVGQTRFTAARRGIYFFTLSIGVSIGLNVRVQIKSSLRDQPFVELWRSSTAHNGADTMSTAIMVQLLDGEQIYVDLKDGEIQSGSGHQAFFGGFFYEPIETGAVEMAWSVYSERPHASFSTSLDPLPFENAWVNTADMFSFVDYSVNITISGLYYMNLNVGVQPITTIDAYIVLAREMVQTNIYRSSTNHNGEDTLNQGILVRLQAGANVRVVLGPNSRTHSDADHQTIFTGFLLLPE